MPYADLSTGVRLYYDDVGSGPTLIALHGWLGTGRLHLGHVIDWLSPRFRVIAPSLRGYGNSRPPQRDFPNDFYYQDAEDVLALMDVLGVDTAHIIGYSDGGEVALIAAGTQPQRFASVAVWGAVGYFGEAMRPVAQRSAPATFLSDDPELMALHGIENAKAFVGGWIRAVVYMIDRGGDISLSLAPKITCPVMLMLGDQDTLNPQAFGQRFVDATPNGRLVMFEQCGHPIHDEQTDAFQLTLNAFWKLPR
ncbi:MAG: alpha/beta fold hydrolase [Phototrophicaceae bacterium]|jgi:valacyclovir hydrolase